MTLSQKLDMFGLALDIIGFSILFAQALPTVMRRDFVTSDRVDLDGVLLGSGQGERFMDPQSAKLLEQRRRLRQTCCYWTGGVAVVFGFLLQLAAQLALLFGP